MHVVRGPALGEFYGMTETDRDAVFGVKEDAIPNVEDAVSEDVTSIPRAVEVETPLKADPFRAIGMEVEEALAADDFESAVIKGLASGLGRVLGVQPRS